MAAAKERRASSLASSVLARMLAALQGFRISAPHNCAFHLDHTLPMRWCLRIAMHRKYFKMSWCPHTATAAQKRGSANITDNLMGDFRSPEALQQLCHRGHAAREFGAQALRQAGGAVEVLRAVAGPRLPGACQPVLQRLRVQPPHSLPAARRIRLSLPAQSFPGSH